MSYTLFSNLRVGIIRGIINIEVFMKKEWDLCKEYEEIYLKGNPKDKTDFEIYIEETDRNVVVKVPNDIKPYDEIRLSGLGKKKNDGKYGDLYIRFNKVFFNDENVEYFKESADCNVKKTKKYEYKYVNETCYSVDEKIQEFAKDGWRCVSVQPIITRLNPSENYENEIEYIPDYEINILFEREIID